MQDLLDRNSLSALRVGGDERLARAELRRQIGRLESQLANLFVDAFPRVQIDMAVAAPSPDLEPRVLSLGELERVRDSLAVRIGEARGLLDEQADVEADYRRLLERMLAAPEDFKWVRISRADIGAPGCGHWHSRPRLGPIGMLMGWWRVKVSSGCPLPARLAAVERDLEESDQD
jgi:hypothetical protein